MFDFLFRRTRELEEKLQKKEEQLEECRAVLREANSLQEYEKEYFVKVTEERIELAKGLAKIATESRKGKDNVVYAAEQTEALDGSFSMLSEDIGKLSAAAKNVREAEAADKSGVETERTRESLDREIVKLQEVFADAEALKEELLEFIRSLNVMALSAAIEGQKAGAGAERFVGAAEEIRTKTDEKGKTMVRLFNCIENGKRLTEGLKKETENLKKEKDGNALKEAIDELSEIDPKKHEAKIVELREGLENIKAAQGEAIDSSSRALGEMDVLGTRFLEEQKKAEEAEYYFRRVLGEEEDQ